MGKAGEAWRKKYLESGGNFELSEKIKEESQKLRTQMEAIQKHMASTPPHSQLVEQHSQKMRELFENDNSPRIGDYLESIQKTLSDSLEISEAAMIEAKVAQQSADSVNKKMLRWTIIMGVTAVITGGIAIASLLLTIFWR